MGAVLNVGGDGVGVVRPPAPLIMIIPTYGGIRRVDTILGTREELKDGEWTTTASVPSLSFLVRYGGGSAQAFQLLLTGPWLSPSGPVGSLAQIFRFDNSIDTPYLFPPKSNQNDYSFLDSLPGLGAANDSTAWYPCTLLATRTDALTLTANSVYGLDFTGTALQAVSLTTANLTELILAGCSDLAYLSVPSAELTALDVSDSPELIMLVASGNQLSTDTVNALLAQLVASGLSNGTVDTSGQTLAHRPAGPGRPPRRHSLHAAGR